MKAVVLSGLLVSLASTAVWAGPPKSDAADLTISVVQDPAELGEKVTTIRLPDFDGDENRPAAAPANRKEAGKVQADTHAVYAGENVTVTDLRAAVSALGFLENLPRNESLVIGVVYAANVPAAEASATQTAKLVSAIPGPNSAMLRPAVISTAELGQFRGRLDALFLMPGASTQAEAVLDAVHRRRLVSISNDPACLDEKVCVLMVRSGPRVEIVLDAALADAVGARFSPVFAMVVKRK
jgi:hypothetical protein